MARRILSTSQRWSHFNTLTADVIFRYEDFSVDQFVSVKSNGAKGDGVTDDTKALQAVLDKVGKFLLSYG